MPSLPKDFSKRGYFWMPADVDSNAFATNIGIESGNYSKIGTKILEGPPYIRIYQFPKRRIYVSSQDFPEEISRRLTEHRDFRNEIPTRFVMCNAVHTGGKRFEASRLRYKNVHSVLQDSGGFQLLSGKKDFVDPDHVAKAHSLYADVGVTLDLPTFGVSDPNLLKRCSKLQAENTARIKRGTNAPLLNVSHGGTLKQRAAHLDVVLEVPTEGLCIAGVKSSFTASGRSEQNPYAFVQTLIFILERCRKHFSYFHVLGVSTKWQMAIMAYLARRYDALITSDSSTYVQFAKSGQDYDYLRNSVKIGNGSSMSLAPVTCACSLCRHVRYLYVYQTSVHTFSRHLIWAINNFAQSLNSRSTTENTDWIRAEVPLSSNLEPGFTAALNLLSKPYVEKDFLSSPTSNGLFESPLDSSRKRILLKYEEYYGKKF